MYSKNELIEIIKNNEFDINPNLLALANEARKANYGKKVFFRGLIEFTNYCKNNCYYCGLQSSNKNITRYRLTKDEILSCCETGYRLGFRTFVLQGGEDAFFTDDMMVDIISSIKILHPDCALTLSLGEKSAKTYKRFFEAGAVRYLLRHETATNEHYMRLHPKSMSLENRKKCLYELKKIGFQVGAGFMVGSPYQTVENLADDLLFLKELNPHMIGIGPFIPNKDTKFALESAGSLNMSILMVALARIMIPKALIPATTALGTIDPKGREAGLKAGANVVMPNLSPVTYRKDYALYDNKICTGEESAECLVCLTKRIESAGFVPDFSIGSHCDFY